MFRVAVGILVALYLCIGVVGLNDYVFLEVDSPLYIILARSLSLGCGFSDISKPFSPPQCSRPPLYPILLVPAMWCAPLSVIAAKSETYLISLVGLTCFFFFSRRLMGKWWALAAAAFLAFNPFLMFRFALQPLNEFVDIALVWGFVLWFFRGRGETRRGGFVITAIFLSAVALNRVTGMSLALAYLIYKIRFKALRWVDAGLVLVPLLLYLAWTARSEMLYQRFGAGDPPVIREIFSSLSKSVVGGAPRFIAESLTYNAAFYLKACPRLIFSTFFLRGFMFGDCFPSPFCVERMGGYICFMVVAGTYILFVKGFARCRFNRERFMLSALACIYLVTAIVFPLQSEMRQVAPAIPFLVLLLFIALAECAMRSKVRNVMACVFVLTLLVTGMINCGLAAALTSGFWEGRPFARDLSRRLQFKPGRCQWRYNRAGRWLRENTSPSELVLSDSLALFLFSERQMEVFEPSPRYVDFVQKKYHVRYVTLKASFGLPFCEEKIRLDPRYCFKRVRDFENVLVFDLEKKPKESFSPAAPGEEYVEAIGRALREARDSRPDAYLLNDIAMLYFAIGEYKRALPFEEESNRLQPDMISLTLNLARCYTMAGRYEQAEKTLERALTQEVFQRSYGRIQALSYMNGLYRRLASSAGRDEKGALLLQIAQINISLGYFAHALQNIQAAMDLSPGSEKAREALGKLYDSLGAG